MKNQKPAIQQQLADKYNKNNRINNYTGNCCYTVHFQYSGVCATALYPLYAAKKFADVTLAQQ